MEIAVRFGPDKPDGSDDPENVALERQPPVRQRGWSRPRSPST
jgi:hypothetical protein